MKILYIEDDPASVRVMQRIMQHLGHELILASSAQDSYKVIQNRVDMVFTDIDLPDSDGLSFISKLRELLPHTVIVAMTIDSSSDREKCLAAGCNDYLSKPFEYPAIVGLIQRYASRH